MNHPHELLVIGEDDNALLSAQTLFGRQFKRTRLTVYDSFDFQLSPDTKAVVTFYSSRLDLVNLIRRLKNEQPQISVFIADIPDDLPALATLPLIRAGATDIILRSETEILPALIENSGFSFATGNNGAETQTDYQQLKESEHRYRQIVETAQEGIWIIDSELKTLFVNKKVCDMLGYTQEEMIGRRNYEFKDEVIRSSTLERIKQRGLGVIETHESAFIAKNGKTVFCIVATNGLYRPDGTYYGTLAMLTDITGRKTDEDALRRSEANLLAIVENTSDLVYSLDSKARFITFNQQFKNIAKAVYNFDIVEGANPLDMLKGYDADMAKKWKEIYGRALKGETQQFIKEYPVGDGSVFLSYSINPIRESNRVIGLSCFSRDITRQMQNEAAIKTAAANLAAIIENTSDMVYSIDPSYCLVAYNQKFSLSMKRIFDIAVQPGDNLLELLRKSDRTKADFWKNVYDSALSGEMQQFSYHLNLGEQSAFIQFSINPIRESGNVIGLACFARDVTRQRADELAVRQSEASLRTIFDHIDMGCMLIDSKGMIVRLNTLALNFSKQLNARLFAEGIQVMDCVPPERRTIVSEVMEQVKTGSSTGYQISLNTAEGIRWFDITWAGFNDKDGRFSGYICVSRDITEMKKLELERERIVADLLQRNKALEQFTYIISHNLRAPVANIIGLSSMLEHTGPADADFAGMIHNIGLSADKLDNIIIDLNHILQVNEHIGDKREPVNLKDIINDIEISIKHIIQQENVELRCDFSAANELYTIKGFIYSILYNLLINSIKYRKPDILPVITIAIRKTNDHVIIDYADNGRGIDLSRYGSQIFGLYKRFDSSVEGKGMGLFMVKMQTETLGGTINLQSAENAGCRFTLTFPASILKNQETAVAATIQSN